VPGLAVETTKVSAKIAVKNEVQNATLPVAFSANDGAIQ
jgi:hypothetical protein